VNEEQNELARAVELTKVLVDFEREIGLPDVEKDTARFEAIRARMAGEKRLL